MYVAFLPEEANKLPPRRLWDHAIDIKPGHEPPYEKNRPLSLKELLVVRKWLDDNLGKGFICESRSRSAAPLLLAAKPGGGVRICQDYRGLNNVTIKNRYPLPLIRETLDALCDAKVYTKLDIIAAFNKLRIAEGHEWKTAFITRFSLYESLNYINYTLHDLLDRICTAYLDDVLVYLKNKKEHREYVRTVVRRLLDAGLQIDINKYLLTEILTDHKNLEYFTTTKFNFQIIYRPGARAIRPDALSRKLGDRPDMANQSDDRLKNRHRTLLPPERFDPAALHDMMADSDLRAAPIELITPAHGEPIDDVTTRAYKRNDVAQQLIAAIQDPTVIRWPKNLRKQVRVPMIDCRVYNGKLFYRDRLYAPADDELRSQIVYRAHSSGPAGHPGRVKTLDLITRTWWWPGMSRDIEQYVKACDLCVRSKASRLAPQGFLQPLPLPHRAWSDVSVDYITPLPKSTWYSRTYQHLLVVVCRLTKMRHLIPVTSLNANELADAFVSRVYCLHGCPDNIVSDRGTQFVSEFWTQLSQRLGVTLKHLSSFYPETDGQTERVNSSIEAYLRAFINFH
ncbi:hypothetical protein PTNB29_10442 [Pyrenophora teres f. teres]|nr:hypothetical protein PTNB29_10442 [Pyrenophora teres f. teres]